MDFQIVDGQTLLDPDEAIGLKLSWVATRADLNDAEGADLFLQSHGAASFTWGPSPHGQQVRARYLHALRSADGGDMRALIGFVRS